MNEQAMRFRLGIFMLISLVLLAVLIILFGGLPSFWKSYHHFTVTFATAPGLAPGTPIRRSGVRIGKVKKVDLDGETGQVLVRIVVESKYPITRGDRPTLVTGLLGGDTVIEFTPIKGATNRSPVDEGETLTGVAQANVGGLLSQASGLLPPAQDTLNGLRKSVQRLDRIGPLVEETLREYRDLARATRRMVPHLHGAVKAAGEAVPEWKKVGKVTSEMVPEVRGVARSAQQLLPEIQELAKEARKAVKDLSKQASEAVTQVRRTGTEVQLAVMNWGKLGERLTVLEQTNEDKLEKLVDNLNRTLAGMAGIFTEENKQNLTCVLRNVRVGTDRLESISKNAEALFKEGRLTLQQVNTSMRRADTVLVNVEDATKTLPERTRSIMKNLDEGTDKLNKILTDVRDLLRDLTKGQGTMRKLLDDPGLYNHLNDTACMMSRLMPRLDRILRDLEVFADKIARHPESIGLSGMVHPSAGLKESPSSGYHRSTD
jgi:ABC-type transporter Mla subunit MlaD